jgi:hypothetical protein
MLKVSNVVTPLTNPPTTFRDECGVADAPITTEIDPPGVTFIGTFEQNAPLPPPAAGSLAGESDPGAPVPCIIIQTSDTLAGTVNVPDAVNA